MLSLSNRDKLVANHHIHTFKGFEWVSTLKHAPNANWMTMYNEMIAYKETHGHCNVPKSLKSNPALGAWTRNQRAQYMLKKRGKKSPMTEERISKIEHIGFKWKLKVRRKAIAAAAAAAAAAQGVAGIVDI